MDVLQEPTVRKVFLGPEGSKRPEFLEKCSYLWTLLGSRWISQWRVQRRRHVWMRRYFVCLPFLWNSLVNQDLGDGAQVPKSPFRVHALEKPPSFFPRFCLILRDYHGILVPSPCQDLPALANQHRPGYGGGAWGGEPAGRTALSQVGSLYPCLCYLLTMRILGRYIINPLYPTMLLWIMNTNHSSASKTGYRNFVSSTT